MSILRFESKKEKRRRLLKELANDIATEAASRLDYDPDKDPVLKEFKRAMKAVASRKSGDR